MNFTDALNNTTNNISYTENGMLGYKSTNNPYLDFLYKVSSLRTLNDLELRGVCNSFVDEVFDNHLEKYLLKFILYVRDPRNGLGERRLGRELLKVLLLDIEYCYHREIFEWVVNHLYDYGRWDDLVELFWEFYIYNYKEQAWSIAQSLKRMLEIDLESIKINAPVTLLAKWMPSINTSSKQTKEIEKKLYKCFDWTEKEYRQTLSKLRKSLKIKQKKEDSFESSKIFVIITKV